MDRLRTFVVLMTVALASESGLAGGAPGDQPAGSPAADVPESVFAVTGDVRHCNVYALDPHDRLTVREAVLQAGLAAESATVSVVHSGENRAQWSQLVSSQSAETGELVAPGDVLQVKALSATAEDVQANAVLRTSEGLLVVALADDHVAVGDILMQTGLSLEAVGGVSIPCRLRSRAVRNPVALSDRVMHGDLISVSAPPAELHGRRRGFAPQVSEWPAMVETRAVPSEVETRSPAAVSLPSNDHTDPFATATEPADAESATRPGRMQQVESETGVELSAAPGDDSMELLLPAEPDELDSSVRSELNAAAELSGAVEPPVRHSSAATAAGIAARTVGHSSEVTPGDINDMAPAPPEEVRLPVDDRPRLGPMNLVFIGGLLIAGTLILAGSLRVDQSPQTEVATAVAGSTWSSVPEADVPGLRKAVDAIPDKSSPLPAAHERSHNLLALDESLPDAVATDASEAAAAVPRPVPSPATRDASGLVVATEWFSGEWLNPPAPSVLSGKTPPQPVVPQAPIVPQEPAALRVGSLEPVDVPGSLDSDRMLDDLLHNRLPVEQQAIELPARMTLYGRPNGPRHLRLDPPHPVLAGAHFALSAERRAGKQPRTGQAAATNPESPGTQGGASSHPDRTDS